MRSSPLEFRRTTLKEFAEAQLALVGETRAADAGLTAHRLIERFEKQSGRCSLSAIKLRLEPGFFNSAMIWKPIEGDQHFESLQYIAAGVNALVQNGFSFGDALDHLRGIIDTADNIFRSDDMLDPRVQASIQAEYQLETKGLLINRISGQSFCTARTEDSAVFMVASVPGALVRIHVLETSMSGRRIFPQLGTDEFWTATPVTTTVSKAPIAANITPQVAKFYTNSNTSNTFTKSTSSGFSLDLSIPKSKPKSDPDRDAFRESAIVEIPMADPKLFEKINHHVFRLIEKSRDFGPIDAKPESI